MMLAETYWELMRDPAHWGMEITLMLIFDVLIGAIAWPIIRRHIHKDVDKVEQHEHTQIDELKQRIAVLEGTGTAVIERCHACGRAITQANPLQFYVGGMVGGCAACWEDEA